MGDTEIKHDVKLVKHQRIEFTMTVGKHTATVGSIHSEALFINTFIRRLIYFYFLFTLFPRLYVATSGKESRELLKLYYNFFTLRYPHGVLC